MPYHSETTKYFLLVSFLQQDTEPKQHVKFLSLFLFLHLFFLIRFVSFTQWVEGTNRLSIPSEWEQEMLCSRHQHLGGRDRDADSDPCIHLSSLVTLCTLKVWVLCFLYPTVPEGCPLFFRACATL